MPEESIVLTELQEANTRCLVPEKSLILIYALRASATGRCDYDRFLKELGPSDRAQIQSIIDNIAKNGIKSCNHIKRIRDGIYEIKTRRGVRVFAFMIGNRMIIISSGIMKGTEKVQTKEIDSAVRRKQAFLSMG